MTAWTSDELTRIGTADELEIASARPDGTSAIRGPSGPSGWATTCMSLYVRSKYGRTGGWFPRHPGPP